MELQDAEVILYSLALEYSRQMSPQLPKTQKGLDKPTHQSTSVFSLGGTKAAHQANHYKSR